MVVEHTAHNFRLISFLAGSSALTATFTMCKFILKIFSFKQNARRAAVNYHTY